MKRIVKSCLCARCEALESTRAPTSWRREGPDDMPSADPRPCPSLLTFATLIPRSSTAPFTMNTVGWVCRRCLRSQAPLSRQFLRRQTTQATGADAISHAVLTRARSLAVEHSQLSTKLLDGFDQKTAKKAGEIAPIAAALKEWEKADEVGRRSPSARLRLRLPV